MPPVQTVTIEQLVNLSQGFFTAHSDWQTLVAHIKPKATGCGPVYELGSIFKKPLQSVAIADMRQIKFAIPHYHANGETEIYIVLAGTGRVVVGGKITSLSKGTVIITPPGTAHYVLPTAGLVLAVINIPPFNPNNNIELSESNTTVSYDHEQFKQLTDELR